MPTPPETQETQAIFTNPIGYNSLEGLILGVIDGIVTLMIPVIVLGIVFLGFKFVLVLQSGDVKKYEGLKTQLMYTILGLIIFLGAKGIIEIIKNTIGGILN